MSNKADFTFIRYANVWEDTDIALNGLNIKRGQTGAVICSGGDNALAMLAREPKKIYAFDLNPTQLYCAELKIAAIKNFSLHETKILLGVSPGNRIELYNRIKGDLSRTARRYFDEHLDIIKTGIIHTGKFEHYFQLFRKYVITTTSSRKNYREFSKMDDLAKQADFYKRKINTRRFRALFKLFFGYKMMSKLGRDKNFYNYVDKDDKKANGADIKERVEYGLTHIKNSENPYFDYIANNNFTHAFPQYLREEYYEKIRANLDKIELVQGTLDELPATKLDFFYLSDIFEYMSEAEFTQSISRLSARAKKGSRVLFWNMQNRRYIDNDSFVLNKELSEKLYSQNKSWFYRDLLIYEVQK